MENVGLIRERMEQLRSYHLIRSKELPHSDCRRKTVYCWIVPPEATHHKPFITVNRQLVFQTVHPSKKFPHSLATRDVTVTCTNEPGKCGCVHAEEIAATYLLRRGNDRGLHNAILAYQPWSLTCVTSYSPCRRCFNLLVDVGIQKFAWLCESKYHLETADLIRRHCEVHPDSGMIKLPD